MITVCIRSCKHTHSFRVAHMNNQPHHQTTSPADLSSQMVIFVPTSVLHEYFPLTFYLRTFFPLTIFGGLLIVHLSALYLQPLPVDTDRSLPAEKQFVLLIVESMSQPICNCDIGIFAVELRLWVGVRATLFQTPFSTFATSIAVKKG